MCDDRFSKEHKNEVINEITRHLKVDLREKSLRCVDNNVETLSNKRHSILFDERLFYDGGISKLRVMIAIISKPRVTIKNINW